MRVIQKAFVLRLYPTKDQARQLAHFGGTCRWLWNHLLKHNMEQYERDKTFAFHRDMSAMLPALKREVEWLGETPAVCLQRVTRNLSQALTNCFKHGKGFPKFKKKAMQTDAFYLTNQTFDFDERHVRVPKIGGIRFRAGRIPDGKIMSATVRQDGDHWYCSVLCEVEVPDDRVIPDPAAAVGVDLGLNHYLTTSDGEVVENPRHLRKAMKRLRRMQRHARKCKKGSNNRRKAMNKIRRLHRKVRFQRADFTHKTTTGLIANASVVCVEDLNVKGLHRTNLALSVSDAGWGEFRRQLAYKADWTGKTVVQIGRFEPSSQVCSCCGFRQKMPLSARVYVCPSCGMKMDRDANAARNILAWGLEQIKVGQGMPEPTHSAANASTPVEMALAG